jgi:hypothetical protein
MFETLFPLPVIRIAIRICVDPVPLTLALVELPWLGTSGFSETGKKGRKTIICGSIRILHDTITFLLLVLIVTKILRNRCLPIVSSFSATETLRITSLVHISIGEPVCPLAMSLYRNE